jgi:hypothetical protein
MATNNSVKRCHALLSIEKQLHDSGRELTLTAVSCSLGFSGPDEQPSYRVTPIKRIE